MAVRTGRPVEKALSAARQANGKTVLLDQYTKGEYSQYFEVRDLPVVIQLIGIAPGTVTVLTSINRTLGAIEQPFRLSGQEATLTAANNSLTIYVSGRYRVQVVGGIGNAVCVYGPLLTSDKNTDIPQPSGVQANRPNLFLENGETVSHVIEVEDKAWVFNIYGLDALDAVEVLSVYGTGMHYREIPYAPDGVAKVLTSGLNSIVLDKSGRYKFRSLRSTEGKLLVGNPTIIAGPREASSGGAVPDNNNLKTIAATAPIDGDVLEFNGPADAWQATSRPRKLYLDGGNF